MFSQAQSPQEDKAMTNLEKGLQRKIAARENQKLLEQYKQQKVKEGEMKILADQGKKAV